MKEFEKWVGSDKCPIEISCPGDCFGCGVCKYLLQQGWKAALELVEGLYAKYDMEDWDTVACNIKRDIEQELKDNR